MKLIINEIDEYHTGLPTIYSHSKLEESDKYLFIDYPYEDYICCALDCSYFDIIFCDSNIYSIIDLIKNQFDDQIIELIFNYTYKTIKFNSYNSNFDLSELEYKANKLLNNKHIDIIDNYDDINHIYRYIKLELLLKLDSINMKSANSLK